VYPVQNSKLINITRQEIHVCILGRRYVFAYLYNTGTPRASIPATTPTLLGSSAMYNGDHIPLVWRLKNVTMCMRKRKASFFYNGNERGMKARQWKQGKGHPITI
jgi:hypothetical protein